MTVVCTSTCVCTFSVWVTGICTYTDTYGVHDWDVYKGICVCAHLVLVCVSVICIPVFICICPCVLAYRKEASGISSSSVPYHTLHQHRPSQTTVPKGTARRPGSHCLSPGSPSVQGSCTKRHSPAFSPQANGLPEILLWTASQAGWSGFRPCGSGCECLPSPPQPPPTVPQDTAGWSPLQRVSRSGLHWWVMFYQEAKG